MEQGRLKVALVSFAFGLFALIVFGLLWFFFLGPSSPVGLGWYLFSFASGLTMIILPCTLPLAFVIVPLSMGKGAAKGFGIALAFGIGVALTLSLYGVAAAILGEVAIGAMGAPLENIKNWLYFIAGAFAYLFALGELGLINFKMPSYTGAAPAFIQHQSDYLKALLLGLFLGNIGVGCPHPATPVLLTRIAASGDIFYGWLLFLVHAVGRVLPLLLLALLAILGINALSWLVQRRDKVERATGWAMVFVAAFILVLGLFSHDWWVFSGQHTLLEELTGEEKFLGIIVDRFNLAEAPHAHEIPAGQGLFSLPLWLGNWVLVFLWVLPLWWHYSKTRKNFWFYLILTLLLAQTFIWVLPDRFLNHTLGEEMLAGFRIEGRYDPAAAGFDFAIIAEDETLIASPDILHERPMHVIAIREGDLGNFTHIHPEFDEASGHFKVPYTPPEGGKYQFWAEATYKGKTAIFTFGPFAFGKKDEHSFIPRALAHEAEENLANDLEKAEFWVEAEETGDFKIELSRNALILISLLLIIVGLPVVHWVVGVK